MQPQTWNLTGDGTTRALSAASEISDNKGTITQCKHFQVLNLSGGTLTVGGPKGEVDATHGYPIIGPQSAQFEPPMAQSMEFYDLDKTFLFLGNGDTAVLIVWY